MSDRTPDVGLKIQTREASFSPSSVNAKTRTAELIWSTGAQVTRRGWDSDYIEELGMDPANVRMGRLASGKAPLLAGHSQDLNDVIGVVAAARLADGRGIATVRFADDPESDKIFRKVETGILRSVSVGYRVHRFEKVEVAKGATPVFRAVDWEPVELSIVGIPADPGAFVRSQEKEMPIQNPKPSESPEVIAERERVRTLTHLCRTAKIADAGFLDRLVADAVPVDQARTLILDELAKRDMETDTRNHVRVELSDPRGQDAADNRVRSMADALYARFGGRAPEGEAKQYVRMSAVDMARHLLEARGVSTRMLSKSQIVSRAYATTSDFSALLTETGSRFLRESYQSAPAGIRVLFRRSHARDFRPKSYLQISEAPELEKVNEHGEFKRGAMSEAKESYRIYSYGKIFALSRQAIVNDDLGAFADMFRKLGKSSAEFEAKTLAELLTSNPVMNDGENLFSTAHGNTGTTGAISITTLTEALKKMRLQKGLDGTTPIAASPRFLVVPAALEVVALQYTAQINANQSGSVNPFASRLEVVVDPRLDASSASAWYVAADPGVLPCLEFAYLEGEEGPQVETRVGFDIDGTDFKVRLDFGAGALDWRGLFRNS